MTLTYEKGNTLDKRLHEKINEIIKDEEYKQQLDKSDKNNICITFIKIVFNYFKKILNFNEYWKLVIEHGGFIFLPRYLNNKDFLNVYCLTPNYDFDYYIT